MLVPISVANFLAKYSCSKWNCCRILRAICRFSYRYLGESSAKKWSRRKLWEGIVRGDNTYPWPYSDTSFARWPEDEGALVSDPAGMVIKHSTSYCAWKIREVTGVWPTRPIVPTNEEHAAEIAQRERPSDAKYWRDFLAAQGYTEICVVPHNGYNYVGIDPSYGKWGLVVWFEEEGRASDCAIISAYIDKRFEYVQVSARDFVWIKIA